MARPRKKITPKKSGKRKSGKKSLTKKKSSSGFDRYYKFLLWVIVACAFFWIFQWAYSAFSSGSNSGNSRQSRQAGKKIGTKKAAKKEPIDKLSGQSESVNSKKINKDHWLKYLPKDAILKGIFYKSFQTADKGYVFIGFSRGQSEDNPDLGEPNFWIISHQAGKIIGHSKVNSKQIAEQLGEKLIGVPHIKKIIHLSDDRFILSLSYLLKEDNLNALAILYFDKKATWARLRWLSGEQEIASFVDGQSQLTSNSLALKENKQNIQQDIWMDLKQGRLDHQKNRWDYKKYRFRWNGKLFLEYKKK